MTQTPKDALSVLRDFNENPIRAGCELRSALRPDCGAVLTALLSETVFDGKDPGFRHTINLLTSGDVVIPAIATPSGISPVQALRLTRYILEIDGNFINSLLTALLTRQDLAYPACTLRVLDLVSQCATHLANWRPLIRIHADGEAQVKSRCTALLARYRFGDEAGLERFRRSEPQVRANIMQTLWDVDRDTANAVLDVAVRDADSRVAGNACLALYNSGDTRALVRLAEMIESPEPRNRITAAWVIGQCRDGRFASRLLEALSGELPALRKRSLSSLARLDPIPAAGLSSNSSDDLDLCFVSAPYALPGNGYEVWLHVAGQGGELVPHLRPVDFFVWAAALPPREGEEFLLHYSVEESAQASAAVRIVYPAASDLLERALTGSLAEKPVAQFWALSTYGKAPAKPAPATDPGLETDAAALSALLESGSVVSSDPTEAVRRALAPDSALDEQHLVLLLVDSAFDPEPVRELCEAKQIRLHCWRLSQHPDKAGPPGVFRTEEQSATIWPRFVAASAARYTLSAGRVPTAVTVRNATVKPARFSGRADLLKGGQNA